MESSDDSFAWTDASSEVSDMGLDIKDTIDTCRKKILEEVDAEIKKKTKKRKHTDETEISLCNPENSLDTPKRKKRKSVSLICNDLQICNNSILNNSITLEQDLHGNTDKTKSKKHKKHKDNNESTIIKEEPDESLDAMNESCLIYEAEQGPESKLVQTYKVKSKKNKKNRGNQNECDTREDEADESFDANESHLSSKVIKEEQLFDNLTETIPKKKKKHKSDQNKSTTGQEEHEVSMDLNQSYKVKHEVETFKEPTEMNRKKRKKLKDESLKREDESGHLLILDESCFACEGQEESFIEPSRKKSKKNKKLGNDENENVNSNYSPSIILDDTNQINSDLADSLDEYKTNTEEERKKKKRKHKDKHDEHETETLNTDQHNLTNNNNQLCNNINQSMTNSYLTNNNKSESNQSTKKKTSAENDKPKLEIKKISERLKFEDEDSADSVVAENEVYEQQIQSKQLQQFIQSSKHLTPTSSTMDAEHLLSEEEDVWIVKCPHELDLSALEVVKIPLDSKCKLKLNGKTYQGGYDDSILRVPLVSYSKNRYIVKNMPLKGFIRFRKRIPKVHIPNYNVMENNQTNFISLPETKCRHPLLGINYKKASKIPQIIAERLSGKVSVHTETETKLKRKKHKREKHTASDEGEPAQEKRARKRRRHREADHPAPRVKPEQPSPPSTPSTHWDSEQAIKNNLFGFE